MRGEMKLESLLSSVEVCIAAFWHCPWPGSVEGSLWTRWPMASGIGLLLSDTVFAAVEGVVPSW